MADDEEDNERYVYARIRSHRIRPLDSKVLFRCCEIILYVLLYAYTDVMVYLTNEYIYILHS